MHTIIMASECQAHCSMLKSYTGLLTDIPHLMFEITLTIIQDIVIGLLLWPLAKRILAQWRQKVHEEIDAEHGVIHAPPATSDQPS